MENGVSSTKKCGYSPEDVKKEIFRIEELLEGITEEEDKSVCKLN